MPMGALVGANGSPRGSPRGSPWETLWVPIREPMGVDSQIHIEPSRHDYSHILFSSNEEQLKEHVTAST